MPLQSALSGSAFSRQSSLNKPKYWLQDRWGFSTTTSGRGTAHHPDKLSSYFSKYEAFARFGPDGQPLWYRTSGGVGNVNDIATDSSGNVFAISQGGYVAKFDENGSLLWSVQISNISNCDKIHIASNGNIFVAAQTSSGNPVIIRLQTSGSVSWASHVTSISGEGYSVSSNVADDRVYFCFFSTANSIFESHIIAFNFSGAVQWQRKVAFPTSNRAMMRSVAAYPGYVYAGTSLGTNIGVIYKWTKDGAYQFGIYCYDPSYYPWPTVAASSDGSIFVTQYDGSMNKYNSSGVIQWGRKFVTTRGSYTSSLGADIDSNGDVYYNGFTGNFQGSIFAKLKGDGSGIGYYNSDIQYSDAYTTAGYVDSVVDQYVSSGVASITSFSCSTSSTSISPVTSLPSSQHHALRTF